MSFVITNEQMEIFHQAAVEKYIAGLVNYFYQHYPHLKKTLTEEKFKTILQKQTKEAKAKGFTQQETNRFFIETVLLFGIGFESDPQYSWIQKNIDENKDFAEVDRAQALYFETEKYLKKAYSKDNQQLIQSYLRFKRFLDSKNINISGNLDTKDPKNTIAEKTEKYMADTATSLEKLELEELAKKRPKLIQKLQEHLGKIFPQKLKELDTKTQLYLIASSMQKANSEYKTDDDDHIVLITTLMFLFGYQFDIDPFLPEMSQYNRDRYCPVAQRIEQIEDHYKIWLTQVTEI